VQLKLPQTKLIQSLLCVIVTHAEGGPFFAVRCGTKVSIVGSEKVKTYSLHLGLLEIFALIAEHICFINSKRAENTICPLVYLKH